MNTYQTRIVSERINFILPIYFRKFAGSR